ncbi:MAG: PD40 domain-containing protein, partial [Bacteroidia bacterium]|nr:PD40 domain-containing protein [Bacteroidia bacterium]
MKILNLLIVVLLFSSCKESDQKNQNKTFPDHEIAFVTDRDGNPEIYLMDINGEQLKNITNNDSMDFSPSWSRNKNELYFYSKRDGNTEIYSINLNDEKVSRLSDHPAVDVLPAISPDGNTIVFMSDRNSLSRCVFTMNKDGSNVKALTDNAAYEESPSWSPDGKEILFTRQLRHPSDTTHAANGEIHIMNSDGSNLRRLTNKDGYDSGAQFSPDGKKIAFYGSHNDTWDLFIMDRDGSNVYNLTNDDIECYSPDWSPDGLWLVYTAGSKGNYNLYKINIITKERVQLTNTSG